MTTKATRKMKVFHLVSGDLWAGAEVVACNLLKSLKEYSDLDIQVILLNEGRLADELMASGLAVQVIDERKYSFWEIFRKTRAALNAAPPDIIHAHRYKENLLAFLISRNNRIYAKLITTLHGLPEVTGKRPNLITRLKSKANFFILSRYFAKTVAVSEDIRNTLTGRFSFANESVAVIHNGILFPPSSSYTKLTDRPFVIGSSGRLFPVKDYPLMVEIARAVAASGKTDIRFELAGDGPQRAELESLIQGYGLQDRFILRGHQDDMDAFYLGLDTYINTSVHEGIPMTILEAMAHGLPVIAPAVGGIGEIFVNGAEGFLIEDRNPQDFSVKCLQLHDDYELRARMSWAARERAEQAFSAEKMAERYYRLYRRLVG
jgi:glycosyltransferase involved in cell wall biosynthesis